jgi:hypothetical protein
MLCFQTNPKKPSDGKSDAAATANPAAPGAQKAGIIGRLMSGFGLKRPTQAHLPDDKNKTVERESFH